MIGYAGNGECDWGERFRDRFTGLRFLFACFFGSCCTLTIE